MSFIHGNKSCGKRHETVAEARACNEGRLGTCGWDVPRKYLDFDYMEQVVIEPCGATTIHTDEGWSCADGHSHVYADVRRRQGWDYAHDEEEAYVLNHFGTTPVRMDGRGISQMRRPAHFAW